MLRIRNETQKITQQTSLCLTLGAETAKCQGSGGARTPSLLKPRSLHLSWSGAGDFVQCLCEQVRTARGAREI